MSGLGVAAVSLNQAVQVPLMLGGEAVSATTPIVAGRSGLLRVSVQPEAGFQPREVVARLELGKAAGELPPLEQKLLVAGPSSDAELASTFNFELPGETLSPDLEFAVSLREASGEAQGAPSPAAAYPASGRAPLPAQSSGGPLRLVLVPLQYDADGSGRLPPLDEAQVALYRAALLGSYPIGSVEIRIREPIPYDGVISPNGDGWGEVLQFLLTRRNQDRITNEALPNEYYYGLVMPKASFALYCSGSPVCVLGLSTALPDPTKEFARGSVGIGFTGAQAAGTLAHETGHAHGRLHAPCAPMGFIQNTDPAFPYPDGGIGVWGFDLRKKVLIDPQGPARDFMGYCDPTWVSDYTWRALFERIAFVNAGAAASGGGGGQPMWMVSLDGAGRAKLGQRVMLTEEPSGELRVVDVLDQRGVLRRRDSARFYPYSDLPGGFLLVPEPEPGDRWLRIGESSVHWGSRGNPLPSR